MKKSIFVIAVGIGLFSCSTETEVNQEAGTSVVENKKELVNSADTSSVEVIEEFVVNSWKKYSGTMFDVEYPEGFASSPNQPTFEHEGIVSIDTDEAFFTSPDSSVVFFVYSPQWSGAPENYLNKWENEEIVDQNSSEKQINEFEKEITESGSFKDKEGKYHRAYISITTDMGDSETRKVFGIQYKDQKSYDLYHEAYKKFKKSLKQYAD